MARRQSKEPDAPATVTVYNESGAPILELKVGDAGSARAVVSRYEREGHTVQVKPGS